MKCEEVRRLLDPLIDGELPVNEVSVVTAHVQTCTDCDGTLLALEALRSSLRSMKRPAPPAALRGSVIDALNAEVPPFKTSRWRWIRASLTHAAAVILGGAIVYAVIVIPPDQASPTQSILTAHVRSLTDDRLMQVVAGDPHKIKPWFAGKLDYAPFVVDLTSNGFPLVGARIDTLGERSVAALVYARRKHTINLFVSPDVGPEGAELVTETRRGFNIVSGQHRGFRFWAISDLSAIELGAFSKLLMVGVE